MAEAGVGFPQARVGDMTEGHWINIFYFPPTAMVTGSNDTFSSGPACCRITDGAAEHIAWIGGVIPFDKIKHSPDDTHKASSGSTTCFINGLGAFRVGDKFTCGDIQAVGNPVHLVGG